MGVLSVLVLQLKLVQKCFFYSTAVQGSRQTAWFNVFVSLTITRFLYQPETLISGVFHHHQQDLQLG